MKLTIAGNREFRDYELVKEAARTIAESVTRDESDQGSGGGILNRFRRD